MFSYLRKVQYYETDKMGITHHSNYIRWMEEARTAFLEDIGLPFQNIEAMGIGSPVVSLAIDYKKPCTFGDELTIEVTFEKYNGIQFEVHYLIKNKETKEIISTATSKHCFLKEGRICSLKREKHPIHEILEKALAADAESTTEK